MCFRNAVHKHLEKHFGAWNTWYPTHLQKNFTWRGSSNSWTNPGCSSKPTLAMRPPQVVRGFDTVKATFNLDDLKK